MEIIIAAGIPVIMLLIMYIFGLYTRRNFGWVLYCLFWGAVSYGAFTQFHSKLLSMELDQQIISVAVSPLIQYILISLGVFFAIYKEKFSNLIDGAIYGFAAGLGYAAYENFVGMPAFLEASIELAGMQSFSVSLVYATAASIIGVSISQLPSRHRFRSIIVLLAGFGAGVGYTVFFNFLLVNKVGGEILPAVYSVIGITLMGLYVAGLLRKILIQLGVEKKRADSLLDIVIPIGIELSVEKDFGRLLEKMLLEAKSFCSADAGTLYLVKDRRLEFAVVRNDTLDISIGGTSGKEVTLPAVKLYSDETGEPNHHNVATYAALTGKTVNIADAYVTTSEFDFSAVKEFDERTGYQSVSFLTIPLKNSDGKVLGVLQLLNALDLKDKTIVPFDENLQQLMQSFSSLACAALEGYIQEQVLRQEIQDLRIEIDAVKQKEQVEQITDTRYFQELQSRAQELRDARKKQSS
jgi:hypothetical protein